jgi:hypothetical protein
MAFIRSEILVSMAFPTGQSTIQGRIPATGSGRLFSLLAEQVGGNADGYTVELFSASGAVTPNYPEDAVPTAVALVGPASVHRVIDPLVVASTNMKGAVYIANGQPYYNRESTLAARQDYLWFKITPNVANTNKVFTILITYAEADQ